ncbi:MAG: DUF190 domain-containing protein [archaeon]|nr:DUF190 domain-containing protein [archaeon]
MNQKINSDLEKLDKAIISVKETDEKLSEMAQIFSQVTSVLEETKKNLTEISMERDNLNRERELLQEETKSLALETIKLEEEKAEKDKKIGIMDEEQKKLLEEYEIIREDLQKFQKLASEAEESEFNIQEIQNLLKIYAVLITEIWGGQPHYRILNLLHGDKEEMSRNDIKGATGISGAMVLRAIHELRQASLLSYDEDSGTAKLTKRMFPKKKE